MIWNNEAQILFYTVTGFGLTQIVAGIWYYRRRSPWMLLSIVGFLACIVSDYFAWEAYGSCVLPYPRYSTVRSGLITVCPGQTVEIDLNIRRLQQQQQDI